MKDRYAQSSMRKQTNRMTFGEVCSLIVVVVVVAVVIVVVYSTD